MFNYILILILWTAGFGQKYSADGRVDKILVSEPQAGTDTLYLYFPLKQAGQDSTENANALDTPTNTWYSRMLSVMKEPILVDCEDDIEAYRFTWLRTFHKPIMVRIQKAKDNITLSAKMLSGAGGYDPGQIIFDTTFTITVRDWNKFQSMLKKINFWQLPVETDFRGLDGAEWILEGSTKDDYHFTIRWTPGEASDYGKCCSQLLSLSGIRIPASDIY